MKTKRIWTGTEWRELHRVGRSEQGDMLLMLDGGDVWQFTPRDPSVKTPSMGRIEHASCMRDSKTGAETPLAVIVLEKPHEEIRGNLRKRPPHTKGEVKRARIARRNGRKGGRLPVDGERLKNSVDRVRAALRQNKRQSMRAACTFAVREDKLTISWEALKKHVVKGGWRR